MKACAQSSRWRHAILLLEDARNASIPLDSLSFSCLPETSFQSRIYFVLGLGMIFCLKSACGAMKHIQSFSLNSGTYSFNTSNMIRRKHGDNFRVPLLGQLWRGAISGSHCRHHWLVLRVGSI